MVIVPGQCLMILKSGFDNLDIPTLLIEAIKTQFPAVCLSSLSERHLAPCVIQTSGLASDPIEVFCSILAGCLASVNLTRIYLRSSIEDIDNTDPEAHAGLHVDDTSMHSNSEELDGALQKIVPAMSMFWDKVRALKHVLSPEANISASSYELAKALQPELALPLHGLTFVMKMDARDLGITHTAVRRRPGRLVMRRCRGKQHRDKRIQKVVEVSEQLGNCLLDLPLLQVHGDIKLLLSMILLFRLLRGMFWPAQASSPLADAEL